MASLNQLLAEARAPLVARMDADDVCHPDRFHLQKQFLDAKTDYGVVGTRCTDIDENGRPWPILSPPHPLTHEGFLAAIDRGEPLLCHPSVMYRRKLVLGVGGYHGAFRHCEDLDLWLRLATVTRLGNVAEQLLNYRHYADQVSSRHATEQQTGAAVAKLTYLERIAGRPDPTADLERLPPIDDLDSLFGRVGVAREVRATLAQGLLYSRAALRDEGFELIIRNLREGGTHAGMWRTVARLVRFGDPARAARLAATLVTS